MLKILYFAWMRDHIGHSQAIITRPAGVHTIADLIAHLATLSDGHAKALSNMSVVRVAVNLDYVDLDAAVRDGDEVAFFPPVTGG